jgi:hypothetical protein
MSGEKTLTSGNVAHWSITDGLGGLAAVEIMLDRDSSADDHVEVLALLLELRPPGARLLERGHASREDVQSVKARIGELIGRGCAN